VAIIDLGEQMVENMKQMYNKNAKKAGQTQINTLSYSTQLFFS